MQFTLRYPVDYKKRKTTKDSLYTRLIEEVDGSGRKIVLASATYEIVGLPKLNIEKG